jgi:hypothetical protein
VVKTYTHIEKMVIAATKIERVLRDLKETPYDPLMEKDENATKESSIDKQLLVLNETLIHFFRESGNRNGASANSFGSTFRCQLCQVDDHTIVACLKHSDMGPKCDKCAKGHRVENYGIRCSFYNGFGYLKDRCWKKKDTKPFNSTANYLEVLVNDEGATLTKLNKIYGANHHLSFGNKIPKRRLSMQANEAEGITKQPKGVEARDRTKEVAPDSRAR